MFKISGKMFKMRYLTLIKHQKTKIEHIFGINAVYLQHEIDLMVKVYG